MKNAWVKQAEHVFFIVKDANLSSHGWQALSSWLPKLPKAYDCTARSNKQYSSHKGFGFLGW